MLPRRTMPSPDRAALDALYRERFQHGAVVCADARRAAYPISPDFQPAWGCLSVAAVRNGRERYHFPETGRSLSVDDDVYLIIDPSTRYSYELETLGTARCLMVSFPPWMVVAASRRILNDLDDPGPLWPDPETEIEPEHLSPHDGVITPELRRIENACVEDLADADWYQQQVGLLLTRILQARMPASRAPGLRVTTRRELLRRVARTTDRIHENYACPLDLETLAREAGLSPFHLLRVFKSVHGVTPQEFLQRKRVQVARRLLATNRLSSGRVAERVGFKSRSSLYRWIRRVGSG